MLAIKKIIFYVTVAVSLFIAQSFILDSVYAADAMVIPEHKVQVRIFADRGFILPGEDRGGFLQVYGILIEQDGSERVVWRRLLTKWTGLLEIPSSYEYLYFDENIYLYFSHGYRPLSVARENGLVLQLHRDTGTIIKELDVSSSEVMELRKSYRWAKGVVTVRPDMEKSTPFIQEIR